MAQDKGGEIDINPSMAIEKLDSWIDGAVKLAPNFLIALVVFAVFFGISIFAKRLLKSRLKARGRENLGEILGGFMKGCILLVGLLVSATIVVPTLKVGDLIAGLGVGSVAIGFAFKDILQNWLAGLLILIRQPFEVGDQIDVGDFQGTVDHIETRATIIKTYDGQKAVIPNSDIYTDAVLVKTAYDKRRTQYDVGIGYGDDISEACELIKEAVSNIEGIEASPAPEAFPWDLAASWVTIRVRWWTDTRRGDVVKNKAAVIQQIKKVLDEAGIDMPYETQIQLFHDQTEERDGTPGEQREGWPAEKDREIRSRRIADQNAQTDA